MRYKAFALLLWTACALCSCSAQSDRRWTLLPDSMVAAPVEELRTAAAYRLVSDQRRRECAWTVAKLERRTDLLEAQCLDLNAQAAALRTELDKAAQATAAAQANADRWHRKAGRRAGVVSALAAVSVGLLLLSLAE